jgi:anti-anti-sigma factor
VLAWATDAALSADAIEDLQLALGEAVANAVEHAYPDHPSGECAFSVTRRPDGGVDVWVEDFGTWRPVPSDAGFRGRGILLVNRLGEDVSIEGSPGGGTAVRFRIPDSVPLPDESATRRRAPRGPAADGASLRADGTAVEVAGELDLASARTLAAELFTALESRPGDVTLDLRRLSYLASAGIGLLLEAAQRTRTAGRTLHVLIDSDGHPARVLQLAGLDGLVAS